MELKEGQWYELPCGRWSRATHTMTPLWVLQVYGVHNGSWVQEDTITVSDAGVLTGHDLSALPCTVNHLREATLDESAALTQRCWSDTAVPRRVSPQTWILR